MASWGKWLVSSSLVGAGMTLVTGFLQFGPIAADVSGRTAAHLKTLGYDWVKVAIDGRDVTLTGTAPTPESRATAVTGADSVFGVRVVADQTQLLPVATPYPLTIDKTAELRLTGTVPNDSGRAGLLAAAAATNPGIYVVDDLTAARGAPKAWADWTRFALERAAALATGKVTLSDSTLSIVGTPKDFAAYETLEAALARLPAGMTLGEKSLTVPTPARWTLDLAAEAGRARLTGFLPDAATRDRLLAALKAAFPGGVVDETRLAPGARAGAGETIAWAASALAALGDGRIAIAPEGLSIAGRPKDWATYTGLESVLKSGIPGGMPLERDALIAPVPQPYRLGLATSGAAAVLDGFLPDAAGRDRLLAALRTRFAGGVDDRTVIAPGAPSGFVDAALAVLPGLSRLADGGFELSGTGFALKGAAPTAAILDQIVARLRALMPQGFTLADASAASVLPPPPQVAPHECQARLAGAQASEKILFETGSATLSRDSERVLDTLVVGALACTEAHVTVEGHTDSAGDLDANQVLSERRAAAVVEYLATSGIARDRLTAVGWGEAHPIADNATAEGRQANRRIEFRVE